MLRYECIDGPSGPVVLCSPDLSAQGHGILRAYNKRRAGAWPSRVNQAAHASPDMPVRELGGVGPPVRHVLVQGSTAP